MALVDLVQKSNSQSSFSNQNGQALVEYVLVLVVSVALVIALATQIFTPFRDFLKSYMGDYVACLLETGELPSLGNETTADLLAEEGCNARFEAASVSNGRPPRSSGAGSPPGSSAQNKSGSESEGSSVGGGGAGGAASSSRRGNLLISSMKGRTATEVGSASEKVTEIPLAPEKSSFYNRRDSFSSESVRQPPKTTYVGIAGLTDEEKKKLARKDNGSRSVASGQNLAPPPKKIPIKRPEPKLEAPPEDSPMTFGNFFRFLLIAAIVIALLAVLGGQALKIAKSQEK